MWMIRKVLSRIWISIFLEMTTTQLKTNSSSHRQVLSHWAGSLDLGFLNRIMLWSSGWPETHCHPASASPVLENIVVILIIIIKNFRFTESLQRYCIRFLGIFLQISVVFIRCLSVLGPTRVTVYLNVFSGSSWVAFLCLDGSDCFLTASLGLWVLEQRSRGKALFSLHHTQGANWSVL